MLRAHSSQHVPTQIQVSGEHSMSGLRAPQRDRATLPARMSSIRAREMDTQAKERETGEKVRSIAFQRRNSGGARKIHSHNRKIQREAMARNALKTRKSRHTPRSARPQQAASRYEEKADDEEHAEAKENERFQRHQDHQGAETQLPHLTSHAPSPWRAKRPDILNTRRIAKPFQLRNGEVY